MEIKDATLLIEPAMPVWPGDEQVQLFRRQKIEDGEHANVSNLSLSVHTGTHVDAPYHFLLEGYTVDQIPLDLMVGETQVVRIPDDIHQIDAAILSKAGIQKGIKRVLFKTSNSRYWEKDEKEFQTDVCWSYGGWCTMAG